MTDNEIIRCLRFCRAGDCENCKALDVCDATFSFHKETLDLINRQKAEIERLKKNIDGLNIFTTNHIKVIRLQAMKEFAERLKEHRYGELNNCISFSVGYLDSLVKEMTEIETNHRKEDEGKC